MSSTRRQFLATSLAAGSLLASRDAAAILDTKPAPSAGGPLRILILGGTGLIGPHQVRYAVARGHEVTLFNRGKTKPGLFPDVEHLEGDRNGKLDALKGRKWDVVIDNPSTLPRWVRDAARLLKDSAGHYIFISTISVYADTSCVVDENTPLIKLADPTVEEISGGNYGGLKALAEAEAERAFPKRTTVVRPGLIVGPGDESDRFTYWPVRVARGGEILAPGNPTDPVQFIDARDIGEWIIRLAEQKAFGIYNALGPASELSIAEMLYGMRAVMPGSLPIRFSWVPADVLESHKVQPWSDMPVWLPPTGEYAGATRVSNRRAIAQGLTFRSLADTTRATLEHVATRSPERNAKLRAGLTAERESEVLTALKKAKQYDR